jgi:hypothetical protein
VADYVPRKVEYYDSEGLLKVLLVDEVRSVGGRATPWTMTMKNVRDGGQTKMETLMMDYETKPDPDMFTQEGLQKN